MHKNKHISAIIEGLLFATGTSLEIDKLADVIGETKENIIEIINQMQTEYSNNSRGINIIWLENSVQLATKPEIYEYLLKIVKNPRKTILTETTLETLAIIAYKQPVTRLEIEKIRSVKSDHAVNKLLEYGLVCELGRADTIGRPVLFGTSEEFLKTFGITSLKMLPEVSMHTEEELSEG